MLNAHPTSHLIPIPTSVVAATSSLKQSYSKETVKENVPHPLL
jgi:hypothetical protein